MKLKEATIQQIASTPAVEASFVQLCKSFYVEDSAEFLIAVVKYKARPSTDQLFNIYNLYVKADAPDRANIEANIFGPVDNYVKTRRLQLLPTSQAFSSYDRPLPERPSVFDTMFLEVLRMLNQNLATSTGGGRNFGQSMATFLKSVGLAKSAGLEE